MGLSHPVAPPRGFVEFCARHGGRPECKATGAATAAVALTGVRWQQLQSVQSSVNEGVSFVSDKQLYGRSEWWAYPSGNAGDCEDFVLEKRRRLIAMGWPGSNLLIATGNDRRSRYHAVLVAVTDKGDFVLDNQSRRVEHWENLGYTWRMRQSAEKPLRWLSVAGVARPMGHAAADPVVAAVKISAGRPRFASGAP